MKMDPHGRSDTAWILTFTGRQFWPLEPRADEVFIEDIAHHLSNDCRFTGACPTFYSVAQHSVLVSHLAPPGEDPLWGLLHDASEGYLRDIARPVKHSPAMVDYRLADARLMGVICDRFGLPHEQPAWVKEADIRVLATEWRDVMPPQLHGWSEADPMSKNPEPLRQFIEPLRPLFAEVLFLARFHELMGQR